MNRNQSNVKKKNKGKKGNREGKPMNDADQKSNYRSIGMPLLPARQLTPMRIVKKQLTGAIAAGVVFQKLWNLNNLFVPDITIGGGVQPTGYDQAALFYNRYRVHFVDISFVSTCTNDVYSVCLQPTNGGATIVNTVPLFNWSCGAQKSQHRDLGFGGAPPARITISIDLRKFNGSSEEEYNSDDRFMSVFGAGPTEIIELSESWYNASLVVINVLHSTEIVYYVELLDRIPFVAS
jgi:hypothetical protein